MQPQVSNSSNDDHRTSNQQDGHRMPASTRTSSPRAGANQRPGQVIMSQETKKVEEWAGDCMTVCYNA